MKKVNPRKKPVSQADVNKAKKQATEDAMRQILYLILYILIEKHEAPKEDIHQLAAEVNYYADSIDKGYITWKDVERVVRDEYKVFLPW
jgi:hypothetical protein